MINIIPTGEEFAHAQPIAEMLAHNPTFRSWFIAKTRFVADADCQSMHEQIERERHHPPFWWRHNHHVSCGCEGCVGGRETDIFNIFFRNPKDKFALHIEVKHLGDTLKENQAKRYKQRASCWAANKPNRIPQHHRAGTVLLYSAAKHTKLEPLFTHFHNRLTFEEIWAVFPRILDATQAIRKLQSGGR
ncbi:hypothetical protein [Bradyrhizobium sp. JYMT SZCCT0428]|uniref:hypothetical protein n=1 Tax=Bradyrhizobium sp. JYMT SZCCT0428 TaxID=2807673 RepID=UPI001BAD545D|nr:hypothetical protein [Bradyrhizobium sp. JYMT SZCCT0428]MBR1153736.1 hypothetical protein [Bradyrhizobium sp. JYMT SZCCT0428]